VGLPRLRAHWVRPEIVVQVGFLAWTGNDKLRHPRLLGVRFDKQAKDIVREYPAEAAGTVREQA
jgi:bifunctional non-homologous end joining protein LigD